MCIWNHESFLILIICKFAKEKKTLFKSYPHTHTVLSDDRNGYFGSEVLCSIDAVVCDFDQPTDIISKRYNRFDASGRANFIRFDRIVEIYRENYHHTKENRSRIQQLSLSPTLDHISLVLCCIRNAYAFTIWFIHA